MPTTSENNKRIAKNTVMLYFRMIVMLLISLYTSRVVLNTLGVVDYGVYNVVAGVIVMLGFITGSLADATSRFITVDLGKGDMELLKKTIGNILFIYLLISILIFIVGETIGLWFVTTHLQIPEDRQYAALWVYQLSIFASILAVISSPYNALIIAHERMSAFAYISILDAVMKLLIVFLLQLIPYDKLIIYAILVFVVQTIDRIIYGAYCSKNFIEIRTRPAYDKKLFKEIFSFSGWEMGSKMAVMGYTQGLNILLNIFFGPAVNAARGLAVKVQAICLQFSNNFLMATKPQIYKSYARGDFAYMHKLLLKGSKFGFFILFFIALPISLEADLVLKWWLGIVPDHTANFIRLIMFTSLMSCLCTMVVSSVHATGNIMKFHLIEGSLLLTIVPIAYLLLKFFNVPPESVFIVHISVEIVTHYVRLRIVLPMIKLPIMQYFKQVVVPILLVITVSPIVPLIVFLNTDKTVGSFFIVCILCVLSCSLTIFSLGCTNNERKFAVEKSTNLFRKLRYKV